jgi:hypothetical protein
VPSAAITKLAAVPSAPGCGNAISERWRVNSTQALPSQRQHDGSSRSAGARRGLLASAALASDAFTTMYPRVFMGGLLR